MQACALLAVCHPHFPALHGISQVDIGTDVCCRGHWNRPVEGLGHRSKAGSES
jgi:hypothetical protein